MQADDMLYDSIKRNITLLDNDYDKKLLNEALTHSGLHTFTDGFPDGMDKMIMENGKNISGGQRQRIAIARALYKNADVIILDEPFNELDETTELSMLQYFKTLAEAGKIVILITHNSSSLPFCNHVISLD